MDMTGHVAIVTGASSGIGLATVRELHAMGIKVVATARNEDLLRNLASELSELVYRTGDITQNSLPADLIETAMTQFGRCDIVINNAGVIQVGAIETIDIDKVCHMVRVNVESAFRVAYTALKHFQSVGTGHLINISSLLGTKVRPTAGAYAGTKYAIEALSEALRMEVAKTPIKVSCIEPGLVMTGLHREWDVHPKDSMDIPHPLKPEDIARTVRYVLELPEHVRIPRILVMPGDQQL